MPSFMTWPSTVWPPVVCTFRRTMAGGAFRDIGASVSASGFRRLALYNTHGGNSSLVDVMARDLRAEFGLRTFSLFGSAGASFTGLDPQERKYGFHAGEVETAFLLSATPELVNAAEYTVNYIATLDNPELLLPENSPANFAWLTRDIAPSGVMGDPRPSTAENGVARSMDIAPNRLAKRDRAAGEGNLRFIYGPQPAMVPGSRCNANGDFNTGYECLHAEGLVPNRF